MANGGIIGTVNNPTSTTATGVWQQEEQYEAKVTDTWPQRALFTTKSLRFNDNSSDNLSRTQESSANSQIFTYSTWVKRSGLTGVKQEMASGGSASTDFDMFYFDTSERLSYYSKTSNSENLDLATTRVFRDLSAWYHIVLSVDTTQGTASNRVKLYVNGVLETSYAVGTYPSVNTNLFLNKASQSQRIGRQAYSALDFFDGYMSETVLIDGQQLAPTSFGVTNSDGVWTPIIYSGTYGTNGFNLQFENAAALGTDSSPNGNTFTVNNLTSIDQSTDYPEVNFATLNPLQFGTGSISNTTLSEGNLKFVSTQGGSAYPYYCSTMAVSQGKWYAEFKFVSSDSGTAGIGNGVADSYAGNNAYDYSYYFDGRLYNGGSGESTGYSAISNNDILGCALDLDNNKIYFHINGSYQASGDPANNTGGKSITAAASNGTGVYHFEIGDSGANQPTIECNFGSPSFSISSSNADGNGYGNFEYAVPSGYYALNTANLAEFG